MKVPIPSPAISIVGRHNSGKTTRVERLTAELVARGYDVGSIKHHSHRGFDIDYPGKDSYRHRAAGASETVIAAPGQMACIKTIEGEMECSELLRNMPGHDIVIVEGYRKSNLPTIEIMRAANDADSRVASVFAEGAEKGWPLGTDFTQMTRGIIAREKAEGVYGSGPVPGAAAGTAASAAPGANATMATVPGAASGTAAAAATGAAAGTASGTASGAALSQAAAIPDSVLQKFTVHTPDHVDISNKLPTAETIAVITDIEEAFAAAQSYGIAAFSLEDTKGLADFVEEHFIRPRVSVAIQAGGESRRMGRSKATVPFAGRPLISRLVERLSQIADEMIITTNEPENLEFLKTEFPHLAIKLVRDVFDSRGALPGLYTALQAATNPYVAIVACDMVFASPALVVAEANTMTETGADVVVPVNKHGFEPFHAMYRKDDCIPIIKEILDQGDKRAQAFFNKVKVFEFPQTKVLEVEPMGGCFINANTPEELAAIERSFLDG
ncbi:MAG: molybdopterin-guanine dinucleotide biosynthesis protein B [Coriobacteriaceae bacterium]|jgi:molybdopterin-guanine dinucleotide biosynthesis protein MobB|nr:molybdopterin-guanine dinucleotide biosynthesis protein B [Coriobacteriaceae bacterium]